ncbi:MAG: hypothetical protein WC477_07475 [Patescibacteria group bacterium]
MVNPLFLSRNPFNLKDYIEYEPAGFAWIGGVLKAVRKPIRFNAEAWQRDCAKAGVRGEIDSEGNISFVMPFRITC